MSNASDFRITKTGCLTKYVGPGGDVVIPEGVTEIGYAAFYNNYDIKSVKFSGGLTKIGAQAFEDCTNLEEVILPEGLACVGHSAFKRCTKLKSVTIPNSVIGIEYQAFADCGNLENVSLPSGIAYIGRAAFNGAIKLIDANGFLIINNYLLSYKGNKTQVTIPHGVTMICNGAFNFNKDIEHIIIPATVTSVGFAAFECCKSLKEIAIPHGVAIIESNTFAKCDDLERVDLPASVTSVKQDAFELNSQKLQINIADISILPAKFRRYAAVCFAEDGGAMSDFRSTGHLKYIKANAEKLINEAITHPSLLRLMCDEKLIAPKQVKMFTDVILKTNNPELIAMILDYGCAKVTQKQKETAEKRCKKKEQDILERKEACQNCAGIAGLQFVATGTFDTFENRNALKRFIEDNGGKLVSAISTKVDYLILNDSLTDSEKKRQANLLGIETITEYQFNDMAGRQFVVNECGYITNYVGAASAVVVEDGTVGVEESAFFNNSNITEIRFPASLHIIKSAAVLDCEKLNHVYFASRDIKMDDLVFLGCPNLTIHAPAGSYAETYAKENNIPFVAE